MNRHNKYRGINETTNILTLFQPPTAEQDIKLESDIPSGKESIELNQTDTSSKESYRTRRYKVETKLVQIS